MALLDLLARDDLHIAARTVVGLFRHRVAELIDRTFCLDDNVVDRVGLEILIMSCMDGTLSADGHKSDENGVRELVSFQNRFLLGFGIAARSFPARNGLQCYFMNRKQKSGFSHKESRSTSKHGAGSPPHHSWIYGAHKTGSSPGSESSRGCVFPRTLPQ